LRQFAGARRFVYNHALALQIERHEKDGKHLGYAAWCRELTGWR
jgi:putative transposase